MITEEITIAVDAETAQRYNMASPQQKRKLQFLMNFWLKEAEADTRSLQEIIHQASEEAKARGLTPEMLEDILK